MAPASPLALKLPAHSQMNGVKTEDWSPYARLKKDEIRLAEIRAATPKTRASELNKGHIHLEDGQQRIKWFVTPTLEAALRRLRHYDDEEPILIWVDALCINQNDIGELGEQVQEMQAIYQNASEVSIWLGPGDEKSRLAWRLTEAILKCSGDIGAIKTLIRASHVRDFTALVSLFRRDYFWRIWVVQEVACARKAVVYCGSESMLWSELIDVGNRIADVRETIRDFVYHDKPAALFSLMSGGPKNLTLTRSVKGPFSEDLAPPLLDLLLSHTSKGSSDPHDKVYGLVGISADRVSFGKIDYKRSPRATYVHTACHIISRTNKLDVICLSQNDDNRLHLPTWVPDWERRNLYPSHRVFGLHIRKPRFTASGTEPANATFLEDGEVLVCNGFVVDTITSAAQPLYVDGPESEVTPTLKAFHNWWRVFVDNVGHEELGTFQRAFCGGAWAPEYSEFEEDLSERLYLFFGLIQKLIPGILKVGPAVPVLDRVNDIEAEELEKRQYAMVSSAALRMHAKRLVISRKKLVGLAPMTAEEGDKIVVLLGCDFPVILRDMDGYWQLIGEIYVDGIMNGEAMDGLTFGKYTKQTFNIR